MKKDSRNTLPEYDFGSGVRGRYAQRYREHGNVVALDARAAEDAEVWAPLVGFSWTGLERQIANDTWIRQGSSYHGYEQFAYVLAEEERDRCRETGHWLRVIQSRGDRLSASEKLNSFLIALWIVRPTLTQVPFRFEEAQSGTKPFARHLDRFQWVRGQAAEDVRDEHLDTVARLLPELRAAYADGRRLRTALVLTLRGCFSRDWQSALVCFAAAAEAMLTYSREPGLTDRLAKSYAKLVSRSQPAAKRAQDHFKKLYALRSDIVHGRSYGRRNSGHNLRDLAAFSNLLRRLWSAVLVRPELRKGLDGDDQQREKVFSAL